MPSPTFATKRTQIALTGSWTNSPLGLLDLTAPQIVVYEVPSIILNAARRSRLHPERGREAVDEFLRLQMPTIEMSEPMIRRAYEVAQDLSCKLYHALYLAVAFEFNCPFVTADAKLHRGLASRVTQLVWTGDYEPETTLS